MSHVPGLLRRIAAVATIVLLPACGGVDTITSPSLRGPAADVIFDGDIFPTTGMVKVCNWYEPNSYTMSATGGGTLLGTSMSLQAEGGQQCAVVWQSNGSATPGVVTVTAATNLGVRPERIWAAGLDGEVWYDAPVTSVTVRADATTDAVIWFKNVRADVPPPPPPRGGQGCTPGYWKQSQHFDSWPAPYTPSTPFSSVFGNAFPGKTLLDVLGLGGGGLNALGRHAVAGLLSSGTVEYDLTTAQVISSFNTAFQSGQYEAQKDLFDRLNNQGCPLN